MPSLKYKNRDINFEWFSERQHEDQATLVLINGITSDSRNYQELYETIIAKNIPILAIDNTNIGKSTRVGSPITFEEQVEEIVEVVKQEKVNPIWIATSAAAGIACKAAHEYGAAGLLLGSPLLTCGNEKRLDLMRELVGQTFGDESMKKTMNAVCFLAIGATFLNKNPLTPFTALMIAKKLYNSQEFEVVWNQISGQNRDEENVIRALKCPTLITYGREEMIQPLHILEDYFNRDNAEIVKFPVGHSVFFEAKEDYLELLEDFYNRISA